MRTAKVTVIRATGVLITGASAGTGNAVNNDVMCNAYPPLTGGNTLILRGGTASVAIDKNLVEGEHYKFRAVDGTDDWTITFTKEVTVAFNE